MFFQRCHDVPQVKAAHPPDLDHGNEPLPRPVPQATPRDIEPQRQLLRREQLRAIGGCGEGGWRGSSRCRSSRHRRGWGGRRGGRRGGLDVLWQFLGSVWLMMVVVVHGLARGCAETQDAWLEHGFRPIENSRSRHDWLPHRPIGCEIQSSSLPPSLSPSRPAAFFTPATRRM